MQAMADKKNELIQLPGGFFLPRRQLMRLSAMGLTSAICVGVSMQYNMMSLDLDLNRNPELYKKMGIVGHLFSFSSWFGCSMWVSFVGGVVMFNNLPRHVFGKLQSHLFPRYFQFSLFLMLMSAGSSLLWFFARAKISNIDESLQDLIKTNQTPLALQLSIISMLAVNLLYFEPKTTALMFKRHVLEKKIGTGHEVGALRPTDPQIMEAWNKDEELKSLSKKFGMMHGCSTLLNLITLCIGVAHIWWLSCLL